jgi:hypothetical protein
MRVLRIIAFLPLLYTINVLADISIRYDLVYAGKHHPYHSVQIKRDLLRINQDSDPSTSVLVNLRSGDIVQLHQPSQRFFEINIQTIDQYVSFYKQNKILLQGLIDQGMSQLAPQQRQQLEQFLDQYDKPNKSGQLSIQVTKKHHKILGVDCTVVAILEQKTLKHEACISSYRQLELRKNDTQSLELIKTFIQQFQRSAPQQHQQLFRLLMHPASVMNGLPMQVINYRNDGKVRNIIQASNISLRIIPGYLYRIPSNFEPSNTPIL